MKLQKETPALKKPPVRLVKAQLEPESSKYWDKESELRPFRQALRAYEAWVAAPQNPWGFFIALINMSSFREQ